MDTIKISVSNKRLDKKPPKWLYGKYFDGLRFETNDYDRIQLKDLIDNGYSLTYVFKDNEFERKDSYMTNFYVGTQFIVVDIDKCDIPPSEFILKIKHKPSIYHTSFGNLTKEKDYKYCYHLIYVFDKIIYGKENYKKMYYTLAEDYWDFTDKQARDCLRVFFSTSSVIPNYEYKDFNITYRVNDFLSEDDNKENKENKEKWVKTCSSYISQNSFNNKQGDTKNYPTEKKTGKNRFELEERFFLDLNMKRRDFIEKYECIYPYVNTTQIDPSRFQGGYVDLRNEDYYIIPSSRWYYDKETQKVHVPKVQIGRRTNKLLVDALMFIKIVPNITKEYLVFLLIKEVYTHFDNSDGQFTNDYIIDIAKSAWKKSGDIRLEPTKKSFKVDTGYWKELGYDNWLKVANVVRQQIRSDDIGSLYDLEQSLEDNHILLKENGVKICKRGLLKWLKKNDIPYFTNKDKRNRMIIKTYEEDTSRSSRVIAKICNENGIDVGYRTVQNVINDYKKESITEEKQTTTTPLMEVKCNTVSEDTCSTITNKKHSGWKDKFYTQWTEEDTVDYLYEICGIPYED